MFDTWTAIAQFGGSARYQSASCSVGNKGYVHGGIGGGAFSVGGICFDFWEYNVVTGVWTMKAFIPGPVVDSGAQMFVINNRPYLVAGWGPGFNSFLYEYDILNDLWIVRTSIPPGMNGRAYGASGAVGNNGYFGLGLSGLGLFRKRDWWKYDQTTDSWTQMADSPNIVGAPFPGRSDCMSFTIGTTVYVAGGFDGAAFITDELIAYDTLTDTWAVKAPMPTAFSQGTAFSLGNFGYVTGATNKVLYRYDSINNTWAIMSPYPGLGQWTTSFTYQGFGYVGTGNIATPTKEFFVYDGNVPTTSAASFAAGKRRRRLIGAFNAYNDVI